MFNIKANHALKINRQKANHETLKSERKSKVTMNIILISDPRAQGKDSANKESHSISNPWAPCGPEPVGLGTATRNSHSDFRPRLELRPRCGQGCGHGL